MAKRNSNDELNTSPFGKRQLTRNEARKERLRRRKINRRRLQMESLEDRIVLTTNLFLDFGGGIGMGNTLSTDFESFRDIFGAGDPSFGGSFGTGSNLIGRAGITGTDDLDLRPLAYDFNGDSFINNADITALADAVVPIVERALEPFDIDVVVVGATSIADAVASVASNVGDPTGEFDAYNFIVDAVSDDRFGGGSVGDAWFDNAGLFGIAGGDDLFKQFNGGPNTNTQDEATLTFSDTIFDSTSGTPGTAAFNANLAHRIAYTATHEAFHTFTALHTSGPGSAGNPRLLASGDVIRLGSVTRENPFIVTRFDLTNGAVEPNNYLLTANDPDIGLRDADGNGTPDMAYVTGTGGHDRITLTDNGGGIVGVRVEAFSDTAKTALVATESYTINLATDTDGEILVDGSINQDEIVIDATIAATIRVRGGTGLDGTAVEDDVVRVIGTGTESGVYTPDATTFGDGTITSSTGQTILFEELEPVEVSGFASLTLITPNEIDVVDITDTTALGGEPAVLVTGTSGGVAFESLTYFDVATFTLDLATNDVGAGSSDDLLVDFSTTPQNSPVIIVNAGPGNDEMDVEASAAGVTTTFNGQAGNDDVDITPTNRDLDLVNGPIVFIGGDGVDDDMQVRDDSAASAGVYTQTATTISAADSATITFDGTMEMIFVFGSEFADTFNVNATPATLETSLDGTFGIAPDLGDRFNIAAGDLAQIAGPIEIEGDAGVDTIVINDSANAAAGTYTVVGDTFSSNKSADVDFGADMENLEIHGSDAPNTFNITADAQTTITVEGNDPTIWPGGDVLNYNGDGDKEITGEFTGTITAGGVMPVIFSEIELVQTTAGNSLDDTINIGTLPGGADGNPNELTMRRAGVANEFVEILFDGDTTDGAAATVISRQLFTSMNSLEVNGAGDNDTFTIDHNGGVFNFAGGIDFDGGGQTGTPGDLLQLIGDPGLAATMRGTSVATSPSSGLITLDPNDSEGPGGLGGPGTGDGDEQFITYSGLEPVNDVVPMAQYDFFATGASETINLLNGPVITGSQTLEIDGATFENQRVANKTLVTVNALDGDDVINVNYTATIDGLAELQAYGNELTDGVLNADDDGLDAFGLVQSAGPIYSAFGQGGQDFFNNFLPGITATNTSMDPLFGVVNIDGGGEDDFVALTNVAGTAGSTVTLTSGSMSGAGNATINYGATESFLFLNRATSNAIDVLSTNGDTSYLLVSDGLGDTFTIGNQSADFSVNADGSLASDGGSLDAIAGPIIIADSTDSSTINVDDSGTATLDGVGDVSIGTATFPVPDDIETAGGFQDSTGISTNLTGFAGATISYHHSGNVSFVNGANVSVEIANVNIFASDGEDTINVNATTANTTTRVDTHIGNDANTVTINGDALSANNVFHGSAGFDRTVLNVAADLGATAVFPIASLQIWGDDPAATTNERDSLEINDNSGVARSFTFDYQDVAGGLDIEDGFAIDVNVRTMEVVNFEDTAADNDTLRIEGTSGVDQITVAPVTRNDALIFLGGNPWDGPSDAEAFVDAHPGVAGGGNGPDIQFRGVTDSVIVDDGDASTAFDDDQLFVYAASELGLNDGDTTVDPWDPAGVGNGFTQGGAGQLLPAFASGYDDILLTDAIVTIDNGPAPGIGPLADVIIEDPTEDFVKENVATALPGLVVNSGDEATPDTDNIADDITAVLSFNFGLQVNGGDPVPAFAPNGDRLEVITPGEINVYSDKSTPPEVSITSSNPVTGEPSFPLTFSSIEQTLLTPGLTNQTVNIFGDNNTAAGQNDNYVIVGQDVDRLATPLATLATNPAYNPTGAPVDPRYDVDADGDNEFSLQINGSAPIWFRNVTDLNAFGDDDDAGTPSTDGIDTLDIRAYADDTTQGWDIDVFFDEGDPVQTDGEQTDLIIYRTSLFGGQVSENILVQPSGPEAGEIVATNAGDGSLIVDIDYVNNTDIIVIDDDGFLNDSDTLLLRGADPSTPNASGRDQFDINFGAAGDLANPEVIVTDINSGLLLYRVRDVQNITTVKFDSLGGDDLFNVTPDTTTSVEVVGGSPNGQINGDPDTFNLITAGTGETVNFYPGAEPDAGVFVIDLGGANDRDVSFDEIELLQVDGVAFVAQDAHEDIDYNAATADPNSTIALATDLGSDVTTVLRDLTLHTTNGAGAALPPTSNDVDYYKYTAHFTGTVAVTASFIHANGDVAMAIQDGAGNTVATVNSADDNESLTIPVVSGQDYFVRVSSADLVPTVYTLEVENYAAPVPSGVNLHPTDDSGWHFDDNVTLVDDATLYVTAELGNLGVPLLTAAQAAAGATAGAAVEVLINGVSLGFADQVGALTSLWTIDANEAALEAGIPIQPGTLTAANAGGWLDLVTSRVRIFDGATPNRTAATVLSEPMWMNFDDVAPEAALISVAMLDSSDTGVVGDGVTSINQPAFWGVAEENTKIRIFADLNRDGTYVMVGEARVGSDRTDVASDANLPEGSLGGAPDDGLGLWEITVEPLQDGLYNIRVEVEDQAGNVTVDTATPLELTVDTLAPQRPTVDLVGMDAQDALTQFDVRTFPAAPVVTLNVAPQNTDTGLSTHDDITRGIAPANPGGQGTTDVMLRVSAEPDSNVFLKDGEEVIGTFTMPALPYANQGPGGDIFVYVLVTLDEDPHPLSVEAFDLAANRSAQSEELVVTIDVTPAPQPAATDLIESSDSFDDFAGLTGPIWNAIDNVTNVDTPTFSGVAEKNNIVRIYATDTVSGTVTVIGTGLVGSDESDGVNADGNGRYDVEVSALTDGVYDIRVELEDTAGNISTQSAALQITVDTTPPQRPTIDLQDSDDSGRSDMDNTTISDPFKANGVVDVRISTEAGARIIIKDGETVIDDFLHNAAFDATDGGATDLFGLREINFVANAAAYGIPAEGAHPLTVEAYDTAGNRLQSEELLITIDFTAPAATLAPNLLSTSDSGLDNTDNVTNVVTPAFDGLGERNSIVRIYATPTAGNTGLRQLIGEGVVGSNESDGNRPEDPQLGFWEVTVEPLEDGVYNITTVLEDKAGNISAESAPLQIEIDTYQPNTPFLDVVEASDSGRHDDDNITNDTTPTVTATTHDPNAADHIIAANQIFRIYDRDEASNEVLLYDSGITAATLVSTTLPALAENWHNLKLEVEDRAGNISEDFLLNVLIDATAYLGEGDLHPESDSGVWGYDATMTDHYTNDKLPEFFGTAEANNLVVMEINSGAGYYPAGTAIAIPTDGDDAFQPPLAPNAFVEGNWMLQTTIDDANGSLLADGEHQVRFTFEDVAGNRVTSAPFPIFIDSEGPVITNLALGTVSTNGVFSFDGETSLFDPKPSTGPEPTVSSVVVHFSDGPARTANFQQDALFLATAIEEGHYQLVGDATGPVDILAVNVVTGLTVGGNTVTSSLPGADAILGLELVVHEAGGDGLLFTADDVGEPLADDRFTLVVDDTLTDEAGNALDGESQANAPFNGNNFPLATPGVFPTGDGQHGGEFSARFTIDSYGELGVWAAGNVWVDTNGNYHFDPENLDSSNRDITYAMGITTDDIFAGNFVGIGAGPADGFDKVAAFGELNGALRFLVDLDNDGVADIDSANTLPNIHGLPFAGNWDGNAANGDEVALFTGTTWYLDTNKNWHIDAADTTFAGDMLGQPVAGDFDGDGADDLGTWLADRFYIDFAADGLDGNADASFRFGFIGTREAPIATDMDGDGIDDLGLWVPGREGLTPREGAEWFVLVSHGRSITDRIVFDARLADNVVNFTPDPFGWDISASFGDEFARPVVGNFDPPNLASSASDPGFERVQYDVDGDGKPAQIADALLMTSFYKDLREIAPSIQLFAAEVAAPFGDHDFDSDIDLVDVFSVINAVRQRFEARSSGSGEGESSHVVSMRTGEVLTDASADPDWSIPVAVDDDTLDAISQYREVADEESLLEAVDEFFKSL